MTDEIREEFLTLLPVHLREQIDKHIDTGSVWGNVLDAVTLMCSRRYKLNQGHHDLGEAKARSDHHEILQWMVEPLRPLLGADVNKGRPVRLSETESRVLAAHSANLTGEDPREVGPPSTYLNHSVTIGERGAACPRCGQGYDDDGDGDCAVCGDLTDDQVRERWGTL